MVIDLLLDPSNVMTETESTTTDATLTAVRNLDGAAALVLLALQFAVMDSREDPKAVTMETSLGKLEKELVATCDHVSAKKMWTNLTSVVMDALLLVWLKPSTLVLLKEDLAFEYLSNVVMVKSKPPNNATTETPFPVMDAAGLVKRKVDGCAPPLVLLAPAFVVMVSLLVVSSVTTETQFPVTDVALLAKRKVDGAAPLLEFVVPLSGLSRDETFFFSNSETLVVTRSRLVLSNATTEILFPMMDVPPLASWRLAGSVLLLVLLVQPSVVMVFVSLLKLATTETQFPVMVAVPRAH